MQYPFDPRLKHHLILAASLAVWIFIFLFFTEPLDVNELSTPEKFKFLPIYSLVGALAYVLVLPIQVALYKTKLWTLLKELVIFGGLLLFGFILSRGIYLYVVVAGEPNPYSLRYYLTGIYIPAMLTIVPFILIGRLAFGKYKEKQLEKKKITIDGQGHYEGLRLFFDDIIMLKSSDNYVEVNYLDGKNLKRQLIRTTLSSVEKSIEGLHRTHRSYLINPKHIQQVESEKGKRYILLKYDLKVPVSKSYQNSVNETIDSTTK